MSGTEPDQHYRRISLELSHTWPGESYLRFESPDGAAVMVAVKAGDILRLRSLLPDPEIACAACRHTAPSMDVVAWQPDWRQWRCTDPAACHKRQQEAGMEDCKS